MLQARPPERLPPQSPRFSAEFGEPLLGIASDVDVNASKGVDETRWHRNNLRGVGTDRGDDCSFRRRRALVDGLMRIDLAGRNRVIREQENYTRSHSGRESASGNCAFCATIRPPERSCQLCGTCKTCNHAALGVVSCNTALHENTAAIVNVRSHLDDHRIPIDDTASTQRSLKSLKVGEPVD